MDSPSCVTASSRLVANTYLPLFQTQHQNIPTAEQNDCFFESFKKATSIDAFHTDILSAPREPTMDPDRLILENLHSALGCNGMRNFSDLGRMRQSRLEERLDNARSKLSPQNIASIYARWLQRHTLGIEREDAEKVVDAWCKYLAKIGWHKGNAQFIWLECTTRAVRETRNDKEFKQVGSRVYVVMDRILNYRASDQAKAEAVSSSKQPSPLPSTADVKNNSAPPRLGRSFEPTLSVQPEAMSSTLPDTRSSKEKNSRVPTMRRLPEGYLCKVCEIKGRRDPSH